MYDPNQAMMMWQSQEPTEMLVSEFRVLTPIDLSKKVDEGPAAKFDENPTGLNAY